MTDTIFEELRMATPDVPARRAILLDAAEHSESLDPLHREHLLERYADANLAGIDRSGLFTELAAHVFQFNHVHDWCGDSYVDEDGWPRDEVLERLRKLIGEAVEKLVPSPVFNDVGQLPSSFDAPLTVETVGAA